MTNDKEYISISGLKMRGWTDRLISKLLGDADQVKPNPRYRNSYPMKLYESKRVENIELSKIWEDEQLGINRRREGSTKAVATKKQKLIDYLNTIKISIKILPIEDVYQQACDAYNEYSVYIDFKNREFATIDSDISFLNRITVNYLRHQLTHYDELLETIFGRVGVQDAYIEINRKIFDSIIKLYPTLTEECHR